LLKTGETLSECAIATPKGTKVADVAWISKERFERVKNETECSIAPEICVEIISASNSTMEMQEKRALYLMQGAEEFWLCDEEGNIGFYDQQGPMRNSVIAPSFPKKIEL
jgi:Uma2 family endonuclease